MDRSPLATPLRAAARHADPRTRLAALAADHDVRTVLRALTSLQDGQFATRQATTLGLTPNAVRWLARSGQITSVRRGVWRWDAATGHADPAVAAWLACWPHGTVSHGSAAHHHGLGGAPRPASPEVTVGHGAPTRAPADVRVHVSRDLPARDRLLVGAVPYTSLARTVCDLATGSDQVATLTRVDDAVAAGASPRWLHQRATALADGRDGVVLVRDATAPGTSDELRSWLERTARCVFEVAGLPAAAWNEPVHDDRGRIGICDAVWSVDDLLVVVELEGLRFHTTPAQRRRDAERFNRLLEAGCTVRRFTWHDVVTDPAGVARSVARALVAAGAALDLATLPLRITLPADVGPDAARWPVVWVGGGPGTGEQGNP